jgi:hypothetical protein
MASALCGSTPVVSLGHTHTLKGAVFVVRPSRTGGEQSVEDFQQIKALLVSEAVRSPIVENQQQTDDKAQDARWRHIQKTLNVDCLRAYLKRLPERANVHDFYAARSRPLPPPPWKTFALPFSQPALMCIMRSFSIPRNAT